jgi:hypothetical protein
MRSVARSVGASRRREQADAPKKLADPVEDEQVLGHRGKPTHFLARLVPQGRLVNETLPQPVMLKKASHNSWKVQSAVSLFCAPPIHDS